MNPNPQARRVTPPSASIAEVKEACAIGLWVQAPYPRATLPTRGSLTPGSVPTRGGAIDAPEGCCGTRSRDIYPPQLRGIGIVRVHALGVGVLDEQAVGSVTNDLPGPRGQSNAITGRGRCAAAGSRPARLWTCAGPPTSGLVVIGLSSSRDRDGIASS